MTETKYWYKFFYTECPVCGRGETWKERKYTPKPEYPNERHEYIVQYDYCDVL